MIDKPKYVVLYRINNDHDPRWEVYVASEDYDKSCEHFDIAKEYSGIEGDFVLIKSEIIRESNNEK